MLATGYAETVPGAGVGLPRLSKPFTEAELAAELARSVPRTRQRNRLLQLRAGASRTA
jgi:hypothetical protein